jgi:hypothetical protein
LDSVDLEQLGAEVSVQGTNRIGLCGAEAREEIQRILCGCYDHTLIDERGAFKGIGHGQKSLLNMETFTNPFYRGGK